MAQVLARNTTLAIAADLVRERAGVLEAQESEVFNIQLVDYIHQAILAVSPKVPKSKYVTDVTVTEASNLIDLSALDMASVENEDIALNDSVNGYVSLVDAPEFNQIKKLYSSTDLVDALIGNLSNVDNKWQIQTIRGTNKATIGTLSFTYIRNPEYVEAFASLLDLPEEFIPQMIDIATQIVLHAPKESK